MQNRPKVSPTRLAGLFRIAGLSRPVAALMGLVVVALIGWVTTTTTDVIRPSVASGHYKLTGKVIKVSDGDTINILIDRETRRVRLASIDAPETRHGGSEVGQPYGEASRKFLADRVAGKTLTLICYEKDHYGRDVCDVPAGDTTANHQLVEAGMAWANQQAGGKYLRDRSLIEMEKQARQAKTGLWAEPEAVAPWVWRTRCWKEHQC